jgi:hypothetical protein
MLAMSIVAIALAAAISATGCGGSSKSSDTGTGSKTELIAKADAICHGVNERLSSTRIGSADDYARLLPSLAAYRQTAADELGKLTPPASMAADWKQIVADAHTLAAEVAKIGEVAKTKDFNATAALVKKASGVQAHLASIAARNGVKECNK